MLFAVLRRHGMPWASGTPMREQAGWTAHAAFMDALVDDGFIVLGGPMGEHHALIVVDAASSDEARARLAADPWEATGFLVTESVQPWEILLGERPGPVGA
jgi:uncharacterized protein YciI